MKEKSHKIWVESSITMMIRSRARPSKRFSRDLQCSFFACRGGNENDFQLISCFPFLVFLPIYTQFHRTVWINRFIFMTRFFWFWWDCKKIDDGVKSFHSSWNWKLSPREKNWFKISHDFGYFFDFDRGPTNICLQS